MDAKKASEVNKQTQKGLTNTIVELLESHILLLGIELDEAKQFYIGCFIRVAIIAVFSALFFVLFSIGVLAYFWDSYRMMAILVLLGIYFLIVLGSAISLLCLNKKTSLFKATKEELAKDKAAIYDK